MPSKGPKKSATIQDIADAVGVTKTTVSLVLSDKGNISPATRQAVRRAAKRLKFEPNPHAQRLSNGRCHNTITLLSLEMDLGVGTEKLRTIQGLLARKGYDVPVYAYGFGTPQEMAHQAMTMIRALRHQRPRAILCNTRGLPAAASHELKHYREEGGLLVCYDHPVEIDCDKVVFDRENNTYQAARHLLELGHHAIGLCVPGSPEPQGPRLQGFERALREWKIKARGEWLFGSRTHSVGGGLCEEAGAQLAEQFLQLKKRPTALCITDDSTAMAFAAALERAGVLVPEDVSVVGHDDRPVAQYGPLLLTTVSHPVAEIAHHVIELVSSRIEGSYDGPAREIRVDGKLVERRSTQPFQVAQSKTTTAQLNGHTPKNGSGVKSLRHSKEWKKEVVKC